MLARFTRVPERARAVTGPRSPVEHLQVIWLLLTRLCVLYVVLFSAFAAPYFHAQYEELRLEYIYLPLAILFFFSAVSALLLRFIRLRSWYIALQCFLDIVVVTWIVYLSGGPVSPFLFLYLPVVMVTSILLSRAYALWIAALSTVLYSTLIWVSLRGVIRQIDGSAVISIPSGGVALQILGLLSAMVLVAVATSYLVRAIRAGDNLVAKSQREYRELSIRQRVLIDGIPEGVITTLSDLTISSINRSVETLLHIHEEEVLSRPLPEVLFSLTESFDPESIDPETISVSQEIEVKSSEGSSKQIAFYGRSLQNDEVGLNGYIFIFQDITALRSVEERLAAQDRLARLMSDSETPEDIAPHIAEFVGESPVMKKVFALIERVAPSDATVLVSGESGTGKELAAKAIHARSNKSSGPFVAVNCGAIPENLIESQLFGHKKGSFTGAVADHDGYFREADGGTIFLDEIGELPLHLQTKLLRVLQERLVRPVGSDRDFSVDVRIVAATNRNLRREVEVGRFREDLFYRLNVINISLPPLRERREDIALLVSSLIKRLVGASGVPTIPPVTMELLLKYNYPGNVRELENILERALVLGGDVLLPEHLPDLMKTSTAIQERTEFSASQNLLLPVNLDEVLGEIEKKYLLEALEHSNGVRKKAAEMLGINFRSFRYRLQKFGLHDEQ